MEAWEKKYWAQINKNKGPITGRSETISPPAPRISLGPGEAIRDLDLSLVRPGGAPSPPPVKVTEGQRFYRILQTGGFGQGSVPLVRAEGFVTPDMAQREYVSRGQCLGYPVEAGTLIDMAHISPESPRVRRFLALETPFVGKILVEDVPQRSILKG